MSAATLVTPTNEAMREWANGRDYNLLLTDLTHGVFIKADDRVVNKRIISTWFKLA